MWLPRSLLRSCLLALVLTQALASNYPRQESSASSAPAPSSASSHSSTPSAAPSTESSVPPSSASSSPSSTPEQKPTTVSTPPTTVVDKPQTTVNQEPPKTTAQTITNADGIEITITNTITNSATKTSSSASSTPTSEEPDNSGGISVGSIVGMSVAGGIALIGIIAFFIWKFTRKRFSGFDDSEAIKWPDLNSHNASGLDSHPLPVRDTGRAGFDTGSENSLSRVNSSNYSTPDFATNQDPYAVPPLPHLNPNQPYRDDPTTATGYYDPYRGPVPGTLENGEEWSGEAIPMNQMHSGNVAGLQGYEQQPYDAGRQSPGPHAALGRQSPGPNVAYGSAEQPVYDAGRRSPGPQMAYQGYDAGRMSPGPNAAYAGSPAPQAAYGGRMSPGPNVAYNTGYSQAAPPSYDNLGQR